MQSMKSEMGQMPKKERMEWELGERGNWRVICNMMDQARRVLADARVAAQGIVSFYVRRRASCFPNPCCYSYQRSR